MDGGAGLTGEHNRDIDDDVLAIYRVGEMHGVTRLGPLKHSDYRISSRHLVDGRRSRHRPHCGKKPENTSQGGFSLLVKVSDIAHKGPEPTPECG
jgi:hypothetical protein